MRIGAAVFLVACLEAPPALCERSGGVWCTCAPSQSRCVGGEAVEPGDAPAMCSTGCACPAGWSWDEAEGCVADCAATDG